ncbi:N-acetylmuramoyl-L-alanine amidase [Oceanobacter sp. 4_MG-2023]|uniref:N-acetylmuramoyl-L-alanine amidase n=1 Tax=Oceanobacter sp. 4_MG-2023 TaxID=3062623 RepID=UPI0027325C1B|nr:N-acetylmuramoyl-L-alanine amidase [Oceanobacter sp. 4_MG-2023]MDP2548068.1 N-acetylmuramoyl-L-alanine amidase [Oceanobacter sp. 4_MG-2023]
MGIRRKLSHINTIIIHCADVPNGRANTIEDVDAWHRQRGFSRDISIAPKHQPQLTAVGYHFVIEVDGCIRPGRPLHETGAHVSGHNLNSIGICLIGRDQFTQEQWSALRALVLMLLHPGNGLMITQVNGHYEYSSKTCPGFDVIEWASNNYQPIMGNILEVQ